MCPNGAGKVEVKKGYMEYYFFKKIILQIKEHASAITLAVNGESFLHPRFFDMARFSFDNGIKVLLNTNATMLNRKNAEMLLEKWQYRKIRY